MNHHIHKWKPHFMKINFGSGNKFSLNVSWKPIVHGIEHLFYFVSIIFLLPVMTHANNFIFIVIYPDPELFYWLYCSFIHLYLLTQPTISIRIRISLSFQVVAQWLFHFIQLNQFAVGVKIGISRSKGFFSSPISFLFPSLFQSLVCAFFLLSYSLCRLSTICF